jgi:hypothetical protein
MGGLRVELRSLAKTMERLSSEKVYAPDFEPNTEDEEKVLIATLMRVLPNLINRVI